MSVNKTKDGRWVVRYRKGRDPDRPTTNKKYFGRGDEAHQAAIEFNLQLGLRRSSIRDTPMFFELGNKYLQAKHATMASSSFDNLYTKLEKTIYPLIGHLMSHHITPIALDDYVATRARSVKLTSVHRELCDIRAIIRWSVKRRLIAANPMDGFEMPKRDDAQIQPPTKAEFNAILQCAAPHLQRAMLVAYHTGLRPGREEMFTLQWDAVDFINRTIMIISAKKGGLPSRIVPLNKIITEKLTEWYDADQVKETRHIVHYNGYKITTLKTAWTAAKKRARVTRRLRLYDIRHRAITNMLEAGADLKSVSEIAGHSSTDMTTRVYQHVSSDLKRKAVELLD